LILKLRLDLLFLTAFCFGFGEDSMEIDLFLLARLLIGPERVNEEGKEKYLK